MASTRAFEELLERLHAQGWSGLGFADIAFVHHTHVKRWYFTDKRGQLRRKLRRNLTLAKLVEAFSRNGEDAAVVALVIMHDGDDAPMKVAPLDAAGLRWLLLQGTGHRRMTVRAVARFVPPRGPSESVLRMDWRPHLVGLELRTARAALADADLPLL